MKACQSSYAHVIKILVEDGSADLTLRDEENKTALDCAHNRAIIYYLKTFSAKPLSFDWFKFKLLSKLRPLTRN